VNRKYILLIIGLAAIALIYAIVLQATGQTTAAEKFVEWAGGGIGTLTLLVFFFGGED
jgi:hypothetical protein